MARLLIPVSLLAALLFIAVTASGYKTTITTVEIDGYGSSRKQYGQGKCTLKLQSANLKQCERYVMGKCSGQDVIALRGFRRNLNQDLEQCCEQLRELNDQECQCLALLRIMQKQSEQLEGREMLQMEQELKKLPERCEIELPRCELGSLDL